MISKQEYEQALSAKAFAERYGQQVQEYVLKAIAEYEQQLKQGKTTPIYTTLLVESKHKVTPEQCACVEETVDELLSDDENAEDPGLLLGKIQCGKTETFERIIALAFDKGFDIAIVLTKGTEALITQTVSRLQKDFKTFWEFNEPDDHPIVIEDIMRNRSGFDKGRIDRSKTIIVAKKQKDNLDYLIKIFSGDNNEWMRQKKVLIVDDEADFASRNYCGMPQDVIKDEYGNLEAQKKALKLAVVSSKIDELRKLPHYCRYLQVTATPYSLFLQPNGNIALEDGEAMPFRPRFTTVVPIHSKYVGGFEYFELAQDSESPFSHLYFPVTKKNLDVLRKQDLRYLTSGISSGNLRGLTYSLLAYFMATAIRSIQYRNEPKSKGEYKSSAVYHVDTKNKKHEWQEQLMKRMVEQIEQYFTSANADDPRLDYIVNEIYEDFKRSSEKARVIGKQDAQGNTIDVAKSELPSLHNVIAEVKKIFEDNKFIIKVVNTKNDVTSMLDPVNGQLRLNDGANIFIGGSILDRGITINNMLCFFYGRDPKQQDTVLQHARFYGSRSMEDIAVTRLYTSEPIYAALKRMNALDDQLREWILKGFSGQDPRMIFVGYDKNFKPCANSKVKPSKALVIKPGNYFAPKGMKTGTHKEIKETVEEIDKLITDSADYANQDENGFFYMDKDLALKILAKIESTYLYDDENIDRASDMRELEAACHYCSTMAGGKVLVIHRTNRNMSRIRENGAWSDMPADGRTDMAPAREVSNDVPVLMLLRQNGEEKKEQVGINPNGTPKYQNKGWMGTPFYWPLLLAQKNIDPVLFASDVQDQGDVVMYSLEQLLEGLNEEEVVKLTFKGDMEDAFGSEGSEYPDAEDAPVETRAIRDTTANKFLEHAALSAEYAINPDVEIDSNDWADVYSYNSGRFPFILRPYKYMVLYNGHGASLQAVLLELHPQEEWRVFDHIEISKDGYLVDFINGNVKLIAASDTTINPDRTEKERKSRNVCQWVVEYPIRKVVKFLRQQIADNSLTDNDTDEQ